jgi:RNA polymerase sigma-70 factor (ECF subfamily)
MADRGQGSSATSDASRPVSAAEARLVERLRQGDADAEHKFVRAYYPGVFRYLLYLTGRREQAEDLCQETFLQAWRRLETFQGRAPLRLWLHRIAHREFLQALRSQRPQGSLEEVAEPPSPPGADWTEAMELREAIRKLPTEEGEIVVLHYMEGYRCEEIAQIVRAPVTTVKYRLLSARSHLQRELGEDDMSYLNEQEAPLRRWAWLPLDQMHALQARLATAGSGRSASGAAEPSAERLSPEGASEASRDVVDTRLTRKVSLALKATALSDICEHLTTETSIHLTAGPSVADEKVTLFCREMPLREVMRQLSRPFGYTWLRSATGSGSNGRYRYELVQDLRSQLLEEELRNRDRNTALLVLEREIQRYRPYLDLSPDEALARAKTAPPEEKKLLEKLAGHGWGPIQLYCRLSPQDLSALRAGEKLTFTTTPKPGERSLAADLARGVIQTYRDWRVRRGGDNPEFYPMTIESLENPAANPPLTADPEVRARIHLWMEQSELGRFALDGTSGVFFDWGAAEHHGNGPCAVGASPEVLKPENAVVNAKLVRDRSLRAPVTVSPVVRPKSSAARADGKERPVASQHWPLATEKEVTTAEVLEALHRATGMPIVGDYYTRLFPADEVAVQQRPLFDALNQLGDATQLRWQKDGDWLQFRSTTFYHDRLKEVPNRLLARWTSARRERGTLALDDLIEIAQLPDPQLGAGSMAEGAKELHGLAEWDLARNKTLRPHLRFLSSFTAGQRQEMMSAAGLPFQKMTLSQQQQFIAFAALSDPLSLEELNGATMRGDYSQPGGFQWANPDFSWHWSHWLVVVEPGREGRWAPRPLVRERTKEAALRAVGGLERHIRERAVHVLRHLRGQPEPEPPVPLEAQIYPTKLNLTFIYIAGASNRQPIHTVYPGGETLGLLW